MPRSLRSARLLSALTLPLAAATIAPTAAVAHPHPDRDGPDQPAAVVLAWERASIRTVYTQANTPVPIGALYLAFTSLAMHEAVRTSTRLPHSSEVAAAAVAAHDVLAAYFPAFTADLDRDLTASLATVADGRDEARGATVGHQTAAALVAERGSQVAGQVVAGRVGDGRGDGTVLYTKAPGVGVWQPDPGTGMLAPWLGSVTPLVLGDLVDLDGPDALTSVDYTADFDEVKRLGAVDSTERTPWQTDTARFFNSNSAIMVTEGVLAWLDTHPLGLRRTARMFARMHVAAADGVITTWRAKRDVGFWRPYQAIARAAEDDNPATSPQPGWTPLLPKPPYSDYVSGHASLTAPAVEVVRMELGEDTALTLHSYATGADRTYATLGALEHDAFHARIWGGLHFRKAMDDGYAMGHATADRVVHALH